MKQKILLLILLAFSTGAFAQTGITLFGYVQDVLPGTIPRGTDENGKPLSRGNGVRTEYLIYLGSPQKTIVHPVALWIHGEEFSARSEKIGTPIHSQDETKTVLVKKTSRPVLRIIPLPAAAHKDFTGARAKAA